MCARVFYLILAALFVFVTATVAAFVYLQWWQAILASAATFVMLVLSAKYLVRYFVGSLADIAKGLFEAKSRVLRNATADIQSVKPATLPQEVAEWIENAEIPSTDPDDEGPDLAEIDRIRNQTRWFTVEATIFPDAKAARSMTHWDIDDLRLVPFEKEISKDPEAGRRRRLRPARCPDLRRRRAAPDRRIQVPRPAADPLHGRRAARHTVAQIPLLLRAVRPHRASRRAEDQPLRAISSRSWFYSPPWLCREGLGEGSDFSKRIPSPSPSLRGRGVRKKQMAEIASTRMAAFRDHFSGHAADYRAFRPEYPPGIFEFLASRAPACDLAWDAATGNGQAAVALAELFNRVVATDASAEQIRNSRPDPRVEYHVSQSCPAAGVDLVTVCQAIHWLDLDPFYAEVRRVLKPGGLFAAVGYRGHRVNPAVNAVIDHFEDAVHPFWPTQRQIVENRYSSIPFPFAEIAVPAFVMTVNWDNDMHLGYLRTWSAAKEFIKATGRDPVEQFATEFTAAWGDAIRTVTWELIVRAGSIE